MGYSDCELADGVVYVSGTDNYDELAVKLRSVMKAIGYTNAWGIRSPRKSSSYGQPAFAAEEDPDNDEDITLLENHPE
jgi:hypothetical protein